MSNLIDDETDYLELKEVRSSSGNWYAIRKAVPHDFATILELIKEFARFQNTPQHVGISLEQLQKDERHFKAFVAETSDGSIVAFVSYFYCYYSWSGRAIYLDDLYVQPEYRAQGIGTALLDKIIEAGRTSGCRKVRWQVSNWNRNAIAFYKKFGATIDDVEINCDLRL